MSDLRGLAELGDLESLPVIVRADLNVPIDEEGGVMDDGRIVAAATTIRALMDGGAFVIVLAHLGRPGGRRVVPAGSLLPVAERLSSAVGSLVAHAADTVGPLARASILNLRPGDAVLLENVRFEPGEDADDDALARALAAPGRAFVFDAFGAAHRRQASTTGIARHLPAYAGLVVAHETAALGELRDRGAAAGVVVAGGAKAAEKLPALADLARSAEAILVGGALAHVFLAQRGASLGSSIVDRGALGAAAAVEAAAAASGCELVLPTDVVSTDGLTTDARIAVEAADAVGDGRIALDIGPETAARYAERIRAASHVVWDGPAGAFEMEPFRAGTDALIAAVSDCPGTVVVGGGDTTAALRASGRADAVTYVSTGGASMLDLLAGRDLPALEGLRA